MRYCHYSRWNNKKKESKLGFKKVVLKYNVLKHDDVLHMILNDFEWICMNVWLLYQAYILLQQNVIHLEKFFWSVVSAHVSKTSQGNCPKNNQNELDVVAPSLLCMNEFMNKFVIK